MVYDFEDDYSPPVRPDDYEPADPTDPAVVEQFLELAAVHLYATEMADFSAEELIETVKSYADDGHAPTDDAVRYAIATVSWLTPTTQGRYTFRPLVG